MKPKDVIVLKEVVDDLNDGKAFFMRRVSLAVANTSGIAFWPISNPWPSTRAFMFENMVCIGCFRNGFPMRFITKLPIKLFT